VTSALGWYWRRLRLMEPGEIQDKLSHRLWLAAEGRRVRVVPTPRVPTGTARWGADVDSGDLKYLVARASSMLNGEWEFISTRDEDPIDWHRDPVTGTRAPVRPSWKMDLYGPTSSGSVKTVWEKNRHQHLQALSAAAWLTGDAQMAELVCGQLISWLDANPYLTGINWSSGIEVALRLVSWAWIDRFLRDTPQHELLFGEDGVLWRPIYLSQRLLRHTLSTGSSANNHLIAELLGIVVANAAWPTWDDSASAADEGWARLQSEVLKQTWPGGFSREQAAGYHLFVMEMAVVALLEARLSRREPNEAFSTRLLAMLGAAESLHSERGERADFGDSDDSQVLGFLPLERPRFAAVAALVRAVSGGVQKKVAESPAAQAAARLALGSLRAAPEQAAAGSLSDAGVVTLSKDVRKGRANVWFDVGPLGMLPMAAHGHSDALSVVVHVDGTPILVDSGTYEFGLSAEWRAHFRGSGAHNVVTVDGLDQSVQGGDFTWATVAAVRRGPTGETEVNARAMGSHDGYTRLARVGAVSREISLDAERLIIMDRVGGEGRRSIEARFHLHPTAVVSLEGPIAVVNVGSVQARLILDPSMSWRVVVGGERDGWFSDRFGQKVPAPVVIGLIEVKLPWEGECHLEFQ
jgi:Heparinase II/III-like protein/Heparinase II/III N-terminus